MAKRVELKFNNRGMDEIEAIAGRESQRRATRMAEGLPEGYHLNHRKGSGSWSKRDVSTIVAGSIPARVDNARNNTLLGRLSRGRS